jgi:hypothetical protein
MDKRSLSERDISAKFIIPAIRRAVGDEISAPPSSAKARALPLGRQYHYLTQVTSK